MICGIGIGGIWEFEGVIWCFGMGVNDFLWSIILGEKLGCWGSFDPTTPRCRPHMTFQLGQCFTCIYSAKIWCYRTTMLGQQLSGTQRQHHPWHAPTAMCIQHISRLHKRQNMEQVGHDKFIFPNTHAPQWCAPHGGDHLIRPVWMACNAHGPVELTSHSPMEDNFCITWTTGQNLPHLSIWYHHMVWQCWTTHQTYPPSTCSAAEG